MPTHSAAGRVSSAAVTASILRGSSSPSGTAARSARSMASHSRAHDRGSLAVTVTCRPSAHV